MNTRDVAAEYRMTHWAQVMQERAERRISIRLYCEEAGIHENTYFYWQRKLREAACSETQSAGMVKGSSYVPQGWATLRVKDEPAEAQGLTVEAGGCRIKVLAETDPSLLAKVCRVLRAL